MNDLSWQSDHIIISTLISELSTSVPSAEKETDAEDLDNFTSDCDDKSSI